MQDGAGLTDAQLLEMFVSQKDQAAFEALVRRYGSMVLKVCLRVIRNHHDAEDACQATFLLMARKASSIKSRDRVANWLHGVAFRTALNARKLAAARWGRERQIPNFPEPQVMEPNVGNDWQPLLDQEISRLAEVYRLPILLCDLEGKSIKKVAQQLGWPQGTVAGRLARGRKMLAKRLARHGLAMASGAVLLQNSASASLPPSLIASTVKAAGAFAAGKSAATGLISANVAILIQGELTTMFWTKLKIATAVLVVGSVFALGGGVLLNGSAGGQQIEAGKGVGKPTVRQVAQSTEKPDTGKKISAVAKTDHEKLQGTWKVVEVKIGGEEFPSLKDSPWSIGRDKMAIRWKGDPATKLWDSWDHVSYHFWGDNDDATPAPNNINMTFHSPIKYLDKEKKVAMSSKTSRGLFALEGDRLKLCFRERGEGKRPTEMPRSSSKDDNLWFVVLQRETAAPKTDEEKLQGDWEMVGVEMDGEPMDLSKDDTRFLSFVGDLMSSTEHERTTRFTLDGTKSPKHFIQVWESQVVGLKTVGIYSLEGDQLKICNPEPGKDAAPDDFSAAKGSDRTLITLKRVKSVGEEAKSSKRQDREDAKTDEPAQKEESKKNERADAAQFCMFVFGPKAEVRVLVQVDGENVALDLDGDGKFEGKGERFKSEKDCKNIVIADPDGKTTYVITNLQVSQGTTVPEKVIQVGVQVRGPFNYSQSGFVKMALDRKSASQAHAHFNGPLKLFVNPTLPASFKRDNQQTLLATFIQTPTEMGVVSINSVDDDAPDQSPFPKGVHPFADVEYPALTKDELPIKRRYALENWNQVGFYGSVEVPDIAGAGKAKVTIWFEPWAGAKVEPAIVEIPIDDAKPITSELTKEQVQAAKKVIERLGGVFEPYGGEHGVSGVKIHGAAFERANDNLLKNIPNFPFAFGVCLPSSGVTDAGMKHLANLKNLSALMLIDTNVTDAGLKNLGKLEGLRLLSLEQAKITDVGLKELVCLKNLRILSLSGTNVTDVGLKELANLNDLSKLSLDQTKVTDAGVRELQKAFPKCEISRR
jgi:RNA polymerase sigma factor (sigma-70 family)